MPGCMCRGVLLRTDGFNMICSYPHQPPIPQGSYTHDLWIHVVLQCEKGSLRNGEKGECPSMANPACFWREDCPGYVKLSAAIQWEKLHRCQKQGVKAHDVMEFVSYDIHRRLFSLFYMHIFLKGVRLYEPEDGTCHRTYPTASSLKEQTLS